MKKANTYGAAKEIKVNSFNIDVGGNVKTKYYYERSSEKFERPVKTAYKITIHKSYRENGKVKKKQYYISTIDYYSMAEYGLEDCINPHIVRDLADELKIDESDLWDMIYDKYSPIAEKVIAEFEQSEEHLTQKKNDAILQKYREDKDDFSKQYECDSDEYDYCYDVFGNLMNAEHLKQIQQNYKAQKEYQKRSYQNSNYSNYNSYSSNSSSSYSNFSCSTYTDEERTYLKRIYKAAAMKLHPDVVGDDGKAMQFLNKLKDEWNM